MSRLALVPLVALGAACAGGGAPSETRVQAGRPLMGTVLEITVNAPDRATGERWIEHCFAQGELLENHFSTYRSGSDLSRLNQRAGGGPIALPAPVRTILQDAVRLSDATGGAFDVTVGGAVGLWRRAGKQERVPGASQIDAARAAIGSDRLSFEQGGVALAAGSGVDLGGLAKGWALDRMASYLRSEGVASALLNFGGSSLAAIGGPGDGPSWRVLLRGEGHPPAILSLIDQHASISDSFGQWQEIGGERFSHVIDPRTARPIARRALAIAVGPDGATAEAWSTALLVSGRESIPVAEGAKISALIRDEDGIVSSPDFPAIVWLGEAPVSGPPGP